MTEEEQREKIMTWLGFYGTRDVYGIELRNNNHEELKEDLMSACLVWCGVNREPSPSGYFPYYLNDKAINILKEQHKKDM